MDRLTACFGGCEKRGLEQKRKFHECAFYSDNRSPVDLLELPRADPGHALLLELRQAAAGPARHRLFRPVRPPTQTRNRDCGRRAKVSAAELEAPPRQF